MNPVRWAIASVIWMTVTVFAASVGIGVDDDVVTTAGAAGALAILAAGHFGLYWFMMSRPAWISTGLAVLVSVALGTVVGTFFWDQTSGDGSPTLTAAALVMVIVGPSFIVLAALRHGRAFDAST